jgi:hypothetical protein
MKLNIIAVMAVATLLAAGTTFAQNCTDTGPRGQGKGYGGLPQPAAERAARQAACLERNGGVCPNGGPGAECAGLGQGLCLDHPQPRFLDFCSAGWHESAGVASAA